MDLYLLAERSMWIGTSGQLQRNSCCKAAAPTIDYQHVKKRRPILLYQNDASFMPLTPKCQKPFSEVRAGHSSRSFDAKVLKLHVLIGHFITYMGI